jgi:hypothetical protein
MSFLNKNFDGVKRGFSNTFFPTEAASYVVRIDGATTFEKGKKEVVKVSVTILQADNGSLKPGAEACVWWDDGNPKFGAEMLAKNVKTFLCEITGKSDSEITGAQAAAALREGSDLEGCIVRLDTILVTKKEKNAQGTYDQYNVYKFSTPFSEEDVAGLPETARKLLA